MNDTYNNNSDDNSVRRLPQNGWIDLLSTPTSNLAERMKNITRCTLYDHKLNSS